MSSDEERLRQQMASIGARYLTRTLGELTRIGELASQAQAGSATAMRELQRAAHKIHGSGAMFGFHEVSERARTVEQLADYLAGGDGPEHLRALDQDELRLRLAAAVAQLDQVTRMSARNLGIEANVD
jgi:HPt (histidine-containing phosphotransfer) domain-containing protein